MQTDVRRPATREEVAVTLVEALNIKKTGAIDIPFYDVDITRPSVRAISVLAELDILRGDTDASGRPTGRLRPNDPVIRAEVAVIAWRLIEAGLTHTHLTERSSTRQTEWDCSLAANPSSQSSSVNAPIHSSAPAEGSVYVVTAYALNVRLRPDITAPRQTILSAGTHIIVLDTIAGTWAHVRLPDGSEGYVGLSEIAPL